MEIHRERKHVIFQKRHHVAFANRQTQQPTGAHAMQTRPPLTPAEAIQAAERHAKATRRPYIVTERPRVFADTEANRALAKISGEAIIHTAPSGPSKE